MTPAQTPAATSVAKFPRRLATVATVALAALSLSACTQAAESPPEDAGQPGSAGTTSTTRPSQPTATSKDSPAPSPLLSVTIRGDQVSPNAEAIALSTGEALSVKVRSDRPGQLHVHSKPEQYVDFDAGATSTELKIQTPGKVEIEEHDTSAVVAILEVR